VGAVRACQGEATLPHCDIGPPHCSGPMSLDHCRHWTTAVRFGSVTPFAFDLCVAHQVPACCYVKDKRSHPWQIEGDEAFASYSGGGQGDVPTVRGAAIIQDGGHVRWDLKIVKKLSSSLMRIGVQVLTLARPPPDATPLPSCNPTLHFHIPLEPACVLEASPPPSIFAHILMIARRFAAHAPTTSNLSFHAASLRARCKQLE
jgi:hypothetical protein